MLPEHWSPLSDNTSPEIYNVAQIVIVSNEMRQKKSLQSRIKFG